GRSVSAVMLGVAASILVLVALGPRAWMPHLLWMGLLFVSTVLRVRAAKGLEATDDAQAAHRLPWLRASALAYAATWGLLAWVGPPPQTGTDVAALVLAQGGVAIGGCLFALSDRRVAAGFALLVAGPLALRLLSGSAADPLMAGLLLGMLALLMLCLWIVGGRLERERRTLIMARLSQTLHAAQASTAGQLLAQVFDHVGEGICLFDAAFLLRAANARIGELLGLPSELLAPGTPLAAWVRHLAATGHYGRVDVEAEVARRLADVARPVASVAQRQRPDGRSIETRRTPLPEGGFAIVCVDITERVASEAALFDNRRTLEVLLQQTEEGFWFIDNAHRTTDANPAMCRMLGLSRDALLGRTIWEFVDAENEAVFRAQVARRDVGQANTYEIVLTRADGGHVVCVNNATPIHDAAGRKIGAIGLFSDVTAQRQAAATARHAMSMVAEQSRVLALTLDSLSQGVLGFDAQLRLNSWNQRAVELLALPESLLQGKPTLAEIGRWQQAQGELGQDLQAIDDDREREAVRQNIGDDAAEGLDPPRYRRRRPDGRILEVCIHRGAGGGQVRTYTDVTAEVRAAQALVAARDEAERANRAKSVFLSRMSHELRTPLNAILGFGQLMQGDVTAPLAAAQIQRLQQILQGGQHLLALINEVLDLARVETGTLPLQLATVDADAMADECLHLVAAVAAQRPVRLAARQGAAGSVRADATRLRQVLLNLLANAIKYNRASGTVTLHGRRTAERVFIEIEDTGAGLDDAQQKRLFQPFERLDADRDAVEGSGIGLALSRMLMEAMGGEIGVRSVPGQGSCFWIALPPGDPTASLPIEVPGIAASPSAAAGRRRVLYVEDNAVNQLVMEGMLAHRPGLDLVLADSAAAGLAQARSARPDLILMDIQLPGASGFDALADLRADPELRDIPVLAVSASAMPGDLQRAREAGFADYLTKPLELQVLLAAVDRWLADPAA
ncbi:MAG: PAS-domain containing protein, partial [Rhodoferax sp.]|nr:PAS-domain containing protein [Rhodoferax sp.]